MRSRKGQGIFHHLGREGTKGARSGARFCGKPETPGPYPVRFRVFPNPFPTTQLLRAFVPFVVKSLSGLSPTRKTA